MEQAFIEYLLYTCASHYIVYLINITSSNQEIKALVQIVPLLTK